MWRSGTATELLGTRVGEVERGYELETEWVYYDTGVRIDFFFVAPDGEVEDLGGEILGSSTCSYLSWRGAALALGAGCCDPQHPRRARTPP